MNTRIQEVRDKAASYGLNSLTEKEILTLLKLPTDKTFAQLVQEGNQTAKAVLNMAHRYQSEYREYKKITNSQQAYEHFKFLEVEQKEEFWIMLLNRSHGVKGIRRISIGSQTGTVVDIREIARLAIEIGATGVILCHNHPSGMLQPSPQDRTITKQVKEALNLFEIDVLDHVIVGCVSDGQTAGYYSFADNGIL